MADIDILEVEKFVISSGRCSITSIQRTFSVGYSIAVRLVEKLEKRGVVGPSNHVGKREIIATKPSEPDHKVTITAGNTSVETTLGEMQQVSDAIGGKGPFKPDPDFDNANQTVFRVAAGELRAFIERYERLEIEKKEAADGQKEVMAEAKGRGYDTKAIRKLVALRKKDPQEASEEEAVLEIYKEALGM